MSLLLVPEDSKATQNQLSNRFITKKNPKLTISKTLSDRRRWTGSRWGRLSAACSAAGTATATFPRRCPSGLWTAPSFWITGTVTFWAGFTGGGWWARCRSLLKRRRWGRRSRRRARARSPTTPRKEVIALSFRITGGFRGRRSQGRTGVSGLGIASWLEALVRIIFIYFWIFEFCLYIWISRSWILFNPCSHGRLISQTCRLIWASIMCRRRFWTELRIGPSSFFGFQLMFSFRFLLLFAYF